MAFMIADVLKEMQILMVKNGMKWLCGYIGNHQQEASAVHELDQLL